MTNPNLWNQILIWPITNLLIAFYKLCEILHLPGPLGFAIILLTILMRFILYPLMHAQLMSAKKMSDLKPKLDALKDRFKDDKTGLQQAQLAMYKENGVNPAVGCLPTLIQLPILIALYNVFYQMLGSQDIGAFTQQINAILYFPFLKIASLDLTFFGINLAIKPGEWQKFGWWLLLIPIVTAALQWYQSKLMMPAVVKAPDSSLVKSGEKKEEKKDDMADMQRQMMMITPIMFGFFALQLPIGLSLYWNIFSIFGIIQQMQVNKATKV